MSNAETYLPFNRNFRFENLPESNLQCFQHMGCCGIADELVAKYPWLWHYRWILALRGTPDRVPNKIPALAFRLPKISALKCTNDSWEIQASVRVSESGVQMYSTPVDRWQSIPLVRRAPLQSRCCTVFRICVDILYARALRASHDPSHGIDCQPLVVLATLVPTNAAHLNSMQPQRLDSGE